VIVCLPDIVWDTEVLVLFKAAATSDPIKIISRLVKQVDVIGSLSSHCMITQAVLTVWTAYSGDYVQS
jgi:hypothetical protein